MLKKILLSFLFIPVVAAAVWLYLWYRVQKTPISDALNAIPSNTSFIIETRQAKDAWKKLSETNIMWSDLLATQFFNELNKSGHFIDSLFASNPEAYPMMENRPVFISAHLSGAQTFDFLYTFSLPELSKESVINALILGSTVKSESLPARNYDDGIINAVKFILPSPGPQGPRISTRIFYYTVHKGIFSGSFSSALVEDAIRQLNSGLTIINNKDFAKVMNTAGDKTDANVYINYKSFPSILQTFLKPGTKNAMDFLSAFATWSELDLTMKPNALLLNGYTYANDTTHPYLDLFSKQKPQQIDLPRVIPFNTSTLLYFGISDMKEFEEGCRDWLIRRQAPYDKILLPIAKLTGAPVAESLLGWVDNEMGMVITENEGNAADHSFAVFRSSNVLDAVKTLDHFSGMVPKDNKKEKDTSSFRGFTIHRFPYSSIYGTLLGNAFAQVETNYFTVVEDYIVFGRSQNALESFINDYSSGRTLARNNYYIEFSKDNLASEANLYLYSNIARSTDLYKTYVREDYEKDITDYLDLFRKFEAVGLQLSADKGMFYQNIYLRHNPIYKKETSSLWETALDTTIHSSPVLVINHTNQTQEVFVQDDANNIYLISNTGKILWKRKLDEKIISEVKQVDAKKNKKLQLIFNTASTLYLVDRNGKDVDGFPVKLKSSATSGLSLFDYENNRDYRILIPCSDKQVHNFTIEGKEAAKWKFERTEEEVDLPVRHFGIGKKDYLVAMDKGGALYFTNRRGEKVLKPKMHMGDIKRFYIETGDDLASSTVTGINSAGAIVKMSASGKEQPGPQLKAKNMNISDLDHDGKNEMLLISEDGLTVMNSDHTVRFAFKQKDLSPVVFLFTFADGTMGICLVNENSNEVFLLNAKGETINGSPFFGSQGADAGDINKDGHYCLVTVNGKSVFMYPLAN
jgi:hypothetical protein